MGRRHERFVAKQSGLRQDLERESAAEWRGRITVTCARCGRDVARFVADEDGRVSLMFPKGPESIEIFDGTRRRNFPHGDCPNRAQVRESRILRDFQAMRHANEGALRIEA